MILVDMLTFALDTKAPATVVLVSGDKDFACPSLLLPPFLLLNPPADALGTLRNRRYKVIVIAPESASESLRAQADQVLDWRCGVLEMPALSREEKAGKKGMKRGAQEPYVPFHSLPFCFRADGRAQCSSSETPASHPAADERYQESVPTLPALTLHLTRRTTAERRRSESSEGGTESRGITFGEALAGEVGGRGEEGAGPSEEEEGG